MERFNDINYDRYNNDNENVDKNFVDKANLVREKHRGLRDGYDRLQRLAARGCYDKMF